MTDNQKTTLFNYNLEIYKDKDDVLVKQFTLKDDSKKQCSLIILDSELIIHDPKLYFDHCEAFYKYDDYYLSYNSYVQSYKQFEAVYTINRKMFFKNDKINLVVGSNKTYEYIKRILYKSTEADYITVNDNKIKTLKIIDDVSWHNKDNTYITNNFHTYVYINNDFFSDSMKYLLELLKYDIRFKFDYISIEHNITNYISIEECEDFEVIEDNSDFEDENNNNEENLILVINIKNIFKSISYYSLLITYCLIQLENYTFIDWLLRRMDTVGKFEYDESYSYSIKECKLIM